MSGAMMGGTMMSSTMMSGILWRTVGSCQHRAAHTPSTAGRQPGRRRRLRHVLTATCKWQHCPRQHTETCVEFRVGKVKGHDEMRREMF